MNVFDEEAELAEQAEVERLVLLIQAGVTMEEYWAYISFTDRSVN